VETVQQLGTGFPSISTGDVVAMVMECCHDLSAVPPAAEPELIERLTCVRLDLLGAKNAPTVRSPLQTDGSLSILTGPPTSLQLPDLGRAGHQNSKEDR